MGLPCPITVRAGIGMADAAAAALDSAGRLSVGVVGRPVVSGTFVNAEKGRFPDNPPWVRIVSMATTTG